MGVSIRNWNAESIIILRRTHRRALAMFSLPRDFLLVASSKAHPLKLKIDCAFQCRAYVLP